MATLKSQLVQRITSNLQNDQTGFYLLLVQQTITLKGIMRDLPELEKQTDSYIELSSVYSNLSYAIYSYPPGDVPYEFEDLFEDLLAHMLNSTTSRYWFTFDKIWYIELISTFNTL